MNLIQESLQSSLPPKRKVTTGGWISFNCVACTHRGESIDKKARGGVLFTNDGFVYSCFNCGFKAGWQPGKLLSKNTKNLFHWLGMFDVDINKLSIEALREKDGIHVIKKPLSFTLQDRALPPGCRPFTDYILDQTFTDPEFFAVVEYVTNRGFSLEDYNWHWADTPGYKNRVIIPFYQDGRIVGWTGRKITEGNPKYLTDSQAGYVFNIDAQVSDRAYVIVVEGQFDAIAIGGVAIMTNIPTETQCARINQLGKEVIVVPDRDKAGSNILESASRNGWSISVPPWEHDIKDAADAMKRYGKTYTLASILHYKESNNIRIEMQKKRLEKINE